jgi:hypothetical protein
MVREVIQCGECGSDLTVARSVTRLYHCVGGEFKSVRGHYIVSSGDYEPDASVPIGASTRSEDDMCTACEHYINLY